MVSEQVFFGKMVEGTRDYKRLDSMLKESYQKWGKNLLRVEKRIDAALEGIKTMINGMTL